ncbi:hypothetical protein SOPP22_18410 [Shewanella sp. OPT22]|nr:hypothetical protein SOPP22_18410 [Shewanella sp. OPT22]
MASKLNSAQVSDFMEKVDFSALNSDRSSKKKQSIDITLPDGSKRKLNVCRPSKDHITVEPIKSGVMSEFMSKPSTDSRDLTIAQQYKVHLMASEQLHNISIKQFFSELRTSPDELTQFLSATRGAKAEEALHEMSKTQTHFDESRAGDTEFCNIAVQEQSTKLTAEQFAEVFNNNFSVGAALLHHPSTENISLTELCQSLKSAPQSHTTEKFLSIIDEIDRQNAKNLIDDIDLFKALDNHCTPNALLNVYFKLLNLTGGNTTPEIQNQLNSGVIQLLEDNPDIKLTDSQSKALLQADGFTDELEKLCREAPIKTVKLMQNFHISSMGDYPCPRLRITEDTDEIWGELSNIKNLTALLHHPKFLTEHLGDFDCPLNMNKLRFIENVARSIDSLPTGSELRCELYCTVLKSVTQEINRLDNSQNTRFEQWPPSIMNICNIVLLNCRRDVPNAIQDEKVISAIQELVSSSPQFAMALHSLEDREFGSDKPRRGALVAAIILGLLASPKPEASNHLKDFLSRETLLQDQNFGEEYISTLGLHSETILDKDYSPEQIFIILRTVGLGVSRYVRTLTTSALLEKTKTGGLNKEQIHNLTHWVYALCQDRYMDQICSSFTIEELTDFMTAPLWENGVNAEAIAGAAPHQMISPKAVRQRLLYSLPPQKAMAIINLLYKNGRERLGQQLLEDILDYDVSDLIDRNAPNGVFPQHPCQKLEQYLHNIDNPELIHVILRSDKFQHRLQEFQTRVRTLQSQVLRQVQSGQLNADREVLRGLGINYSKTN